MIRFQRLVVLVGLAALALAPVRAATAGTGDPQAGPTSKPDSQSTLVPGLTVVAPKKTHQSSVPIPVLRDFVKAHGAPSHIGQLARWQQDVCPTTVGLPPEFNAFVTQHVKDVAASVGAPTKLKGKCDTNIEIVFTTHPQTFIDSIRNKAPVLLGFHYPAQLKRLTTFSHPIQAWYATATEGPAPPAGALLAAGGGKDDGGSINSFLSQQSGGGLVLDDSNGQAPGGSGGSRFTVKRSSQFMVVTIVADSNKASDHQIGAIADYVALLALSQTKVVDDCSPLPSITNLMSPTCDEASKTEALSEGDIAYLKALYATNLSNALWVQQGDIVDRMRESDEKH
jgi:hypothetical protein